MTFFTWFICALLKIVQRVHLCTAVTAATLMLEPFGEVGRAVFVYFSSDMIFEKLCGIKLSRKIRSKNFSAGVEYSRQKNTQQKVGHELYLLLFLIRYLWKILQCYRVEV